MPTVISDQQRRWSAARDGPLIGSPPALFSELSHELRSPLSTIIIWTQLLKQQPLDPAERERGLAAIERGARALAMVAEDLLDLSRLARGEPLLDRQPFDLAVIVADAVRQERDLAEAKGVSLNVERTMPCATTADGPRLGRALRALVGDALQRVSRGGAVAVRLVRSAGWARMRITLSKPGTTTEPREAWHPRGEPGRHMLEPERLALALAVRLVTAHGGCVELEPRHGGAFRILLPLKPVDHTERGAPEVGQSSLRFDGTRVLVVDDAVDVREVLRVLLEGWGAVVATADSVGDALARLRDFRPEVLLSDLAMPGADGYDLIRQVRALPAGEGGDVRAAALTGLASEDDRRRAIAAGFQEHLLKPVDPPALRAKLAALLGRH
jgi:CheY-like chemotaxis protein